MISPTMSFHTGHTLYSASLPEGSMRLSDLSSTSARRSIAGSCFSTRVFIAKALQADHKNARVGGGKRGVVRAVWDEKGAFRSENEIRPICQENYFFRARKIS